LDSYSHAPAAPFHVEPGQRSLVYGDRLFAPHKAAGRQGGVIQTLHREPLMAKRLPPHDRAAVTMDVKNRCDHAAAALHAIATEPGLIFADPKTVLLNLYSTLQEIEAATQIVRGAWFPCMIIVLFVG
jgi:hypothetical protein